VVTKCKCAFDLLKYERHDRTISVVQCLIYKTVWGTGQIGDKGQDNFLSHVQLSKIAFHPPKII